MPSKFLVEEEGAGGRDGWSVTGRDMEGRGGEIKNETGDMGDKD